jgi:hypothetical protein
MGFNNILLTGMQLKLLINLTEDQNFLYTPVAAVDNTDTVRYVIKTFRLWIPMITFHPKYHVKFLQSINTTPIRWKFLQERIEISSITQNNIATLQISNVANPLKVFVFFINEDDFDAQNVLWQYFDQCITGGAGLGIGASDVRITKARLELNNGDQLYPSSDYTDQDVARIYNDFIEYGHNSSNVMDGLVVSRGMFENVHSMLYFDLEYKKSAMVNGVYDMKFMAHLSGSPVNQYRVYAFVLSENQASYYLRDNMYYMHTDVSPMVL